jgi:hypothetical protein
MVDKRKQPIAVCTVCGAVSYNATLINGPCGRLASGKRCRGVNGSALKVDDWKECASCACSGMNGGVSCERCSGSGWLFVRGELKSNA